MGQSQKMLENKDNQKSFTRRAFVIGGIQGMILGILGTRLAWLQIADGQKYKTLSDKNRIDLKLLGPSRGEIFDRYGQVLAENRQNFRALVIPEQAENLENILRSLQDKIELSENEIQRTLKQASKTAKFIPVKIKDNLQWDDVAKIEVNLPDFPGLLIDVGELRYYPQGEPSAHLVGYVGAVNPSEIKEDRVLSLPGFKIGKTGLERKFEKTLRGKAGTSEIETNVIGRQVRELDRIDSTRGKNITMSIDAGFQQFTQERLNQEKSASAVIMDAKTGAIYALASSPAFDPNSFVQGWKPKAFEELLANPGKPLNNKAVSGQYPPGSTFKMVSALAALEDQKINEKTTSHCSGVYHYGNDKFHCWKWSGHKKVDLVSSLTQSCDVFFYELATKVGINKIAETARLLGLGEKYGFDLNEEKSGLVPDKEWKRGYFGEPWKIGETIISSIGQGYIQTTPLQLAVMTSRLINGGYAVKPWLTAFVGTKSTKLENNWPKLPFNPYHLTLIKRGMDRAITHPDGTAHKSAINIPNMEMGGKTGTAQVKRITMKQRRTGVLNKDLPWKLRHHALFVGYAPIENPRYVCSVVIEHGVSGSGSAAPLARDLLMEVQRRAPAKHKISPSFYSQQTNKMNKEQL